jgi:hypothetical protein
MPCRTYRSEDGKVTGIICSRERKVRCDYCERFSEYQCDFPVAKHNKKRTCDRYLCSTHVRHGNTAGIDFCTEHYPIAKAAHERRMARTEV